LHLPRNTYSETRFLNPPAAGFSAPQQKPGFWENFCISPEILIQKPGF
jgi:hypothetical protein